MRGASRFLFDFQLFKHIADAGKGVADAKGFFHIFTPLVKILKTGAVKFLLELLLLSFGELSRVALEGIVQQALDALLPVLTPKLFRRPEL